MRSALPNRALDADGHGGDVQLRHRIDALAGGAGVHHDGRTQKGSASWGEEDDTVSAGSGFLVDSDRTWPDTVCADAVAAQKGTAIRVRAAKRMQLGVVFETG